MPKIPWLNFYDRLVARYHPRFRPNENLGQQTQLCTVPARTHGADPLLQCHCRPCRRRAFQTRPRHLPRRRRGVGADIRQCIGIEDAAAGVAAIKAAGALPIGVGKAEDLGSDIALVSGTAELTYAYLQNVWAQSGR